MSSRDEAHDARIQGALRKAVVDTFAIDPSAVTMRSIRSIVEGQLDLGEGFFKTDKYWKEKAKEVVLEEVAIQEANVDFPEQPSPEKKKRAPRKKKEAMPEPEKQEEGEEEEVAPKRKRAPAAKPTAVKKAPAKRGRKPKAVKEDSDVEEAAPAPEPEPEKKADSDASMLSDLPDDFDEEPQPPKKKARKSAAASKPESPKARKTKSESPKAVKDEVAEPELVKEEVQNGGGESGNESEMSILIDEPPKKKGRSRSTTAVANDAKKKGKAPAKPRKEKAPGKELTPDDEKIKSLQGWLLKCGVRKMWSRELAKYDNPKDKIKHLKNMLTDVGMTGQYSQAKAKQIKERRELEDEVAAVNAGDALWGEGDDNNEKVTTRSGKIAAATSNTGGRRLVQRSRGLESLDFLGDQSDGDSD